MLITCYNILFVLVHIKPNIEDKLKSVIFFSGQIILSKNFFANKCLSLIIRVLFYTFEDYR